MITLPTTVDRLRLARDARREDLPWNVGTADEHRQMQLWYESEYRFLDAYCVSLMSIFEDLKPVDDPATDRAMRDPHAGLLDELGARVKSLADFVEQEVLPPMRIMYKLLDRLEALPISAETDALYDEYLSEWIRLRERVRHAIPPGWIKAGAACQLYKALPPAMQDQAVALWGPFYMAAPGHFGPFWDRHWPYRHLEALDQRAKKLGWWPLTEARPAPGGATYRRNRKATT